MSLKFTIPLLVISAIASAQDSLLTIAIPEVHIQENRLQIPLRKSARHIQIISQQEIQSLPVKNLNEILLHIAGVDLRQRGAFGTQADISIDGGSFEQTLVLVNGIKMSDPQTAHNTLNLPIPAHLIERIEILRGPAARIYGANSLTGAINIVTQKNKENSLHAHLFAGSNLKKEDDQNELYHAQGAQISGVWNTNHLAQLFSASLEQGTGYRYNTAHKNQRYFYQGDLHGDDDQLQWMAGYTHASFGANGFYAAPGDRESHENVQTLIAAVQSTHKINTQWSLRPQVGYRYTYDDYQYYRHNLNAARSQHYGNALNTLLNTTYTKNKHQFGFGAEWRYEQINSSNIGDHSRSNLGAYAEWRPNLWEKLNMTLGAYSQYNSTYQWSVYPGIDLSYQVNHIWQLLASAGSSERLPSFNDLYLNQAPGNIGNPNLQPETAWQTELGWRMNKENLLWQTHFFYREVADFIDWNRSSMQEPYQTRNHGQFHTFGLTTTLKQQWNLTHGSLRAKASYTYLSPKQNLSNNQLISKYQLESLRHQALGQISYQMNHWDFTLAARFQERLSYTDYCLLDMRMGYSTKYFSYYFDAQNITDKTYVEAGAVPLFGRWFSLGIIYKS